MAHAPYEEESLALTDPGEPEEHKATLLEHLDELRARITRSLFVLTAGWILGWFLVPPIYDHLNTIIRDPSLWPEGHIVEEVFTNFAEPFFLKLKLSLIIGLIITAPLIILQLWSFIRPALKANERKPLRIAAPLSALLFIMGACVAYIVLRPAFHWFLSFLPHFEGTRLLQNPGTYVMFILKMLFAFGLGFQLPLVIWFLGALGLLTSEVLWKQWRIAVIAIVVMTAALTPGGDIFSNVALGIPLIALYFGSAMALQVSERRKQRREQKRAIN